MNDNQMLIAVLAMAALAVVILFRRSDGNITLPSILDVGDSQTEEAWNGPEYLTYNLPYNPGPPVSMISPMPRTSAGELGQVGCGGC